MHVECVSCDSDMKLVNTFKVSSSGVVLGYLCENCLLSVRIRDKVRPCEAHSALVGQLCAVTGKMCITQCGIKESDK